MSKLLDVDWIKTPHAMIISGKTGRGKTHLALDLLQTVYKDYFEHIVILCPTFIENKTYSRKWLFLDSNVHIITDTRLFLVINALLNIFKSKNTLILIDDLAYSDEIKKRSGDFVKLVFSLRHYGITLWVLTQKYNDIVKSV